MGDALEQEPIQPEVMSAEKEIDRLEREINAKTASNGGQGKSGPPAPPSGNSKPPKKGSADSALAVVGLLVSIAVLLPVAGRLTYAQRLALSSGAAGAAGGVAVGFLLGRRRNQ